MSWLLAAARADPDSKLPNSRAEKAGQSLSATRNQAAVARRPGWLTEARLVRRERCQTIPRHSVVGIELQRTLVVGSGSSKSSEWDENRGEIVMDGGQVRSKLECAFVLGGSLHPALAMR